MKYKKTKNMDFYP